ncbi:putative F-112 protein [Human adenovirus 6]|nr:putative F-112 protein [Human adenovirus 6]
MLPYISWNTQGAPLRLRHLRHVRLCAHPPHAMGSPTQPIRARACRPRMAAGVRLGRMQDRLLRRAPVARDLYRGRRPPGRDAARPPTAILLAQGWPPLLDQRAPTRRGSHQR